MTGKFAVKDRGLESQGKRLAAPSRWFVLIALILGVPGIVLVVLASSWAYELGWVLFLLALSPGAVALALLLSSAVARWAARRKLFA